MPIVILHTIQRCTSNKLVCVPAGGRGEWEWGWGVRPGDKNAHTHTHIHTHTHTGGFLQTDEDGMQ